MTWEIFSGILNGKMTMTLGFEGEYYLQMLRLDLSHIIMLQSKKKYFVKTKTQRGSEFLAFIGSVEITEI